MTDEFNLDNLLNFKELTTKKIVTERRQFDSSTSQSTENEAILRSFKELREKLKLSQKECASQQEEIKKINIRLKQGEEALTVAMSNNLKLKDQLSRDEQSIVELKKRLHQMKEQLIKYQSLDEELAFTKQSLLEVKFREKALLEENKKKTELFLQEKMELEQQICRLHAKNKSDEDLIAKLESQSSQSNHNNIKLQNTMRKMSITYQQEQFNQKWSRQNFQTENMQSMVVELQKEIKVLKGKIETEKQKRYQLEDQMVQLEEKAGLDNIKAQTLSGETDLLMKKEKKLMRKIENLQNKLGSVNEEKIDLEERVGKYKSLCEEILSNVNNSTPLRYQELSRKISCISKELLRKGSLSPSVSQNERSQLQKPREQSQQESKIAQNFHKRYQSNPQIQVGKRENRYTFGDEQQNQCLETQLQVKIRRERQQMERKLKEKALQSKLQCSMPNEMYRLRSEYLNSLRSL